MIVYNLVPGFAVKGIFGAASVADSSTCQYTSCKPGEYYILYITSRTF
jgi:hypothetical protein